MVFCMVWSKEKIKNIWKKIMFVLSFVIILENDMQVSVLAQLSPSELYAKSAVLIDGASGRVLYGKNETQQMPMASTTKILTLILTLENTKPEEVVQVSKRAAAQPKVHLGMHEGQKFYVKDLCYAMMLESFNDTAVALAEHICGSVEDFGELMNRKAKEIGCENAYFVTPNGLDGQVVTETETKIHSITSTDLARIMKYCIKESPKAEEFLDITRTKHYQFTDCDGGNSYQCYNHNAFLDMMEGALTGKTGFTNKAGYCYVGAVESDNRTFIVALLACGWPNHRNYKWSDMKRLVQYGMDNFFNKNIFQEKTDFSEIPVENGFNVCATKKKFFVSHRGEVHPWMKKEELSILLGTEDEIKIEYRLPKILQAPVEKNQLLGSADYYLNGEKIKSYPIYSDAQIKKIDFASCIYQIFRFYCL